MSTKHLRRTFSLVLPFALLMLGIIAVSGQESTNFKNPNGERTSNEELAQDTLFVVESTATTSHLAEVNPATGTVVRTFPEQNVVVAALAFDPSTNLLYSQGGTIGAFGLYKIDTDDGTYSLIAANDPPYYGLAIDPNTFELLGISLTGNLYKINKNSGAATLVGSDWAAFTSAHGLAFSPSGILYASDTSGSGSSKLLTIDPTSGDATFVGTINRDFVVSIDFDSAGKLYGSDNGTDALITINPSTGNATTVGSYGNSLSHEGIAFVESAPPIPEPPTIDNIPSPDNDGEYTVCWSAVSNADGYRLQEQFNSGSWTTIYNGSDTCVNRSGLADGTWCYHVRATSSGGNSDWSAVECTTVETTPDPPDTPPLNNINNSDLDGNYTVRWSSAARADTYQLQEQFNGGSWTSIYNGSGTSKSRSGQADGSWCYRVNASNSGGTSDWGTVKCTTVDTIPDPPDPPSINSINNDGLDGDFTVRWSAVDNSDTYQLQEQFNSASWSTIYNGSSISKSRSGQADGSWCYRVNASNSGGASDWSTVKCTRVDATPDPPDPPFLNSISNSDLDGNFTVSWSTATNADSYRLQEQFNGGSWSTIYNGSGTSRNTSGRADGTWCYRSNASNSGGTSDWSTVKCTTVDTTSIQPEPPFLNSISNSDLDGNFTVSWSSVTNADSYRLQEQSNSGSWSTIYNGSATSMSINGKSDGIWCYHAKASNSSGTSDWSSDKCTTVNLPQEPPSVPIINDISNSDLDGNFTVSWSTVPGAVSYQIQEQVNGGNWTTIYDGPEINESISGKDDGKYCYRANSSNATATSEWSSSKCLLVVNTREVVQCFLPTIFFNFYYYHPYEDDHETEPNDVSKLANGALLSNKIYHGAFDTPDDENDYYFFYIQQTISVSIKLSGIPSGQNYDLVLRDRNSAQVGYSAEIHNDNELIDEVLTQGVYYIQVYNRGGNSDPGLYSLMVNIGE